MLLLGKLIQLNRYQEIVIIADKILLINPSSQFGLMTIVEALCQLNRYQEIIELVNRIIELDLQYQIKLKYIAYILQRKSRYQEMTDGYQFLDVLEDQIYLPDYLNGENIEN